MAEQDRPTEDVPPRVVLRPMPAEYGRPPESRFGDRLKDARLQLDLSIEALSRLCRGLDTHERKGISPPTLGRYESNDTLPSLRELRLIAQALRVPVEWLVDGNLPNVRGGQEVQAFVAALRDFVEHVQADIRIGGSRLSESMDGYKEGDYRKAWNEARKPG